MDVLRANPGKFVVKALAARSNLSLLVEQAKEFMPEVVILSDESKAKEARERLSEISRVEVGELALKEYASSGNAHLLIAAVVGACGLPSVIAALNAGSSVALANKETLVAGGDLVMRAAAKGGGQILPLDSEHSSIFQCLIGNRFRGDPKQIILTASGGPFLKKSFEELRRVKPEDAIKHPTWSMGAKISVDSATMMNKGLELIEAAHLFQVEAGRIDALIHPQSLVHGLVEYGDGTLLAALFQADMRIPIAVALSYFMATKLRPSQGAMCSCSLKSGASFLDLAKQSGALEFSEIDLVRFPAFSLARNALLAGGTAPAVLNAANEVAVEQFLCGRLPFVDIVSVVEEVLDRHQVSALTDLEGVFEADLWAREEATMCCRGRCA